MFAFLSFSAGRPQSLSEEFLIVVWPVRCTIDRCRVEEGIAHIDGVREKFAHLFPVRRRSVRMAHSHASKPYRRHPQPAQSKCSVFHISVRQLYAQKELFRVLSGHIEHSFLFVQCPDLCHLIISQLEIENLDILLNMLRIL